MALQMVAEDYVYCAEDWVNNRSPCPPPLRRFIRYLELPFAAMTHTGDLRMQFGIAMIVGRYLGCVSLHLLTEIEMCGSDLITIEVLPLLLEPEDFAKIPVIADGSNVWTEPQGVDKHIHMISESQCMPSGVNGARFVEALPDLVQVQMKASPTQCERDVKLHLGPAKVESLTSPMTPFLIGPQSEEQSFVVGKIGVIVNSGQFISHFSSPMRAVGVNILSRNSPKVFSGRARHSAVSCQYPFNSFSSSWSYTHYSEWSMA